MGEGDKTIVTVGNQCQIFMIVRFDRADKMKTGIMGELVQVVFGVIPFIEDNRHSIGIRFSALISIEKTFDYPSEGFRIVAVAFKNIEV